VKCIKWHMCRSYQISYVDFLFKVYEVMPRPEFEHYMCTKELLREGDQSTVLHIHLDTIAYRRFGAGLFLKYLDLGGS
jgi:hypothetical protein